MGDRRSEYRNEDRPLAVGKTIAELAVRQHGVVSAAQLRVLGLDRSAVSRRIDAGWLHLLYRGVYSVGPLLTMHGSYLAAVVASGPNAALSHRSAADLWGLRRSTTGPVEVTVPRERGGQPGIGVHRSRLFHPADFTSLEAIRVTTVARTLLDLAAVVPERHLARAIDRAERLELFDLAALDDVLSRARGRNGARALRAAIAAWRPNHTRSELEERFEALVRSTNLPLPSQNVLVQGDRHTHEVDAFWPSQRVIVELDGFAFHRTRRDLERDAAKTADLELAGHRVIRLTWDDVTVHADRTKRRLRTLLAKC